MSDNPFAEPDDDRTVFRPKPGGMSGVRPVALRPAAPPPSPPAPSRAEPPPVAQGADLQTLVGAFSNPLIAAAAPLLQLLARLNNTAAPPDQGDMRDRTARELREFERRAREAGIAMDQVRPAHYALCASLDDVVLNTPWGARGRWRERPLAAAFHKDDGAGAGFFDQIRLMRSEPAAHLHVLELMYLCMALGFMGPFRSRPDGPERMERIREQTYELIRSARGAGTPPLSDQWEGEAAPYRPRRTRFPIWVAASVVVAALAGGFVWVLDGLNARSDALLSSALAATPAQMPAILRPPTVRPPPPPPEPAEQPLAESLKKALAPEIADHRLEVIGSASATTIRIPTKVLFPSSYGVLSKASQELLAKIGHALSGVGGPIRVLGYSDNVPIRTVKFPSNFALSKARAETVRDELAKEAGARARFEAEGRAEEDPIASNATAQGREQNRRVEIVIPQ